MEIIIVFEFLILKSLSYSQWYVCQTLMEKRIRPWINKKIIEYIGEPEPTLVEFICTKVLARSEPTGILEDVQMVHSLPFSFYLYYFLRSYLF